jgi:predicted transcriptional regulator
MAESLIEMSKDLTLALIENNLIKPEDMQQRLQQIYASLQELKAREDQHLASGTSGEEAVASISQPIDWKKSIRKQVVECLVCGQTFKQLSARHLRQHDLDPRSYRQQFGIPRTQALSAKETTATRRRVVQQIRPWEKAPTYKKSQEEAAPASPPPPAQPKRARKKAAATSASA